MYEQKHELFFISHLLFAFKGKKLKYSFHSRFFMMNNEVYIPESQHFVKSLFQLLYIEFRTVDISWYVKKNYISSPFVYILVKH